MVRVVLNQRRRYAPPIMKGLLNTPLYIPSAPSISYCANVEVPITILSGWSYVGPKTKG